MHDQNSIGDESASVKYQRALDLFTESVLKPDHDLRGCAYNQGCYEDLMEIREHVLEYLKTLKEVTYHTNPDDSNVRYDMGTSNQNLPVQMSFLLMIW